MLVLSRKLGQSIQIGDNVRIVVTSVKGNRVRIAIEAPSSVAIRRNELLDLVGSGSFDLSATASSLDSISPVSA